LCVVDTPSRRLGGVLLAELEGGLLMEIKDEDKVNVVLSLLRERYNASHKMRERSERFTIWIVGLAFTVIWFLLLRGPTFTSSQKLALAVLVAVIGGLAFWHQVAVNKGFYRNRSVIITMEEVLGAYKEGLYADQKALLPAEYRAIEKFPSRRSLTYHFVITYLWIAVVLITLIVLILLSPTLQHKDIKDDTGAAQRLPSCEVEKNMTSNHQNQSAIKEVLYG